MNIVHQSSPTSFRHAHCQYCSCDILLAPRAGWIEPFPGTSYDRCRVGERGLHQPDPSSDSERPYWSPVATTAP